MRLILVSNRLPVTVVEKNGDIELKPSVGGLATALSSFLESYKSEYLWVGWPGITILKEKVKDKVREELSQFNSHPVFISETTMENFYNGFCNKTIWPLFHYFTSYVAYDEDYWLEYKKVNEMFRDEIIKIVKPGDIIWIHDYHLMLLPRLLSEANPELSIGFFLHIPFPSFEIFRLLPKEWRTEIIRGLLGADLIGFHTYDYTQHFLTTALRLLGYEHRFGVITTENKIVKVDTFPIGINFQQFSSAPYDEVVRQNINLLKKSIGNLKTILSIDRLDYTKGIANRLEGYNLFLEQYPEWRGKVILLLVVVPSRIGVRHYQQMKKQIDELVGEINGRFSTINWTPILYFYKSLSFHEIAAFYSVSDIALVTPLRDGMNLIAKEYVATKSDGDGVLILSEMAGAAKELTEAIIINPNSRKEIAEAIKEALEMSESERKRRMKIMQNRLARYDVKKWAEEFIRNLITIKEEQSHLTALLLKDRDRQKIIEAFKKAKRRILFLDYDGTLVPFSVIPQHASPGEELLKILKDLSENEKNEVVIISGRDRETLQKWFGNLNINLVAEHGIWIKEKGRNWKKLKAIKSDWKEKILPILEVYTDRLPGSFIEEKDFSVVWHYRGADPEHSSSLSKELMEHLITFTANIDIHVLPGNKIIEVRSGGISKGDASLFFLNKNEFDFILAIGDDHTDEDMFRSLPENSYTIRVGLVQSNAKFNLKNYSDVINLLKQLLESDK